MKSEMRIKFEAVIMASILTAIVIFLDLFVIKLVLPFFWDTKTSRGIDWCVFIVIVMAVIHYGLFWFWRLVLAEVRNP